jgi:alpha-N-acetylglucosaminidase
MIRYFHLLFSLLFFLNLLISCNEVPKKQGLDYAGSRAVTAADALLHRLIPTAGDAIIFEYILPDSGLDVFEIESKNDQIVIRGNHAVSMAMGLNWYLKYYCLCDVSLFGSQLNMPEKPPVVPSKVRRVSQDKYRYMLNYCSFGYTLAWWDWEQWEKLIDWMALNGINMPLSVTGEEAVWREVAGRLGIEDLSDFLPGPPYLPFGWMGCLDGWGGPLPESWIDRHYDLQKKILARERELGMTPVLQGFTGHVPPAVVKQFPASNFQKINWIEWETHVLDPVDPLFCKIGNIFIEEQTKLYGTDHLYAADTFIEMVPPSGDPAYLEKMAKSILQGMTAVDSNAVWILQGWAFSANRNFWTPARLEIFLSAVPNEHIILLDLFCELNEMWTDTKAFYGKPWLWCNVQTFGANVDMHGPLNRINQRLQTARTSPERGHLTGIGYVNEGFEGNPVIYEFLTEMAWHQESVDLNVWLDSYVQGRYGIKDESARSAWQKLYQSVYSDSLDYGIYLSVCRYPRIKFRSPPTYDTKKLIEAWKLLLTCADKLEAIDTYSYDLVSVGVQVLANYSTHLHQKLIKTFNSKDRRQFDHLSELFLQLLYDLDELAGTRKEFLLGRWLENAKRWGDNDREKSRLEWNARRILTLWGSGTNLRDYSRRIWSGLIADFYLPRWQWFIKELKNSLDNKKPFNENVTNLNILKWENDWTNKRNLFPVKPKGDYLKISRKMWNKYEKLLY